MELSDNDFELFGLPLRFGLSLPQLHAQWMALQRQTHPDRFAAEGSSAQRLAMQWSVRVNEAYQRLKSPLKRAQLLCELAGFSVGSESNTAMPTDFLMQQMQWREALSDAAPGAQGLPSLQAIQEEVQAAQTVLLDTLQTALDGQKDYPLAVQSLRQLMFFDKLLLELDTAVDRVS
jgi:molecular chaperone HscB